MTKDRQTDSLNYRICTVGRIARFGCFAVFMFMLLQGMPYSLKAQVTHEVYADAGSSTVSSGVFIRPAFLVEHRYGDYYGGAGFRWTFPATVEKKFSGWQVSAGRDFTIRKIPFSARLFFMNSPTTDISRERNMGFLLMHDRRHLDIHFGYHLRNYHVDDLSGSTDPAGDYDGNMWEYRNFIYRGTLRLNEPGADWNLSASVTNYDHFLYQQETNPMLNVAGRYRIMPALQLRLSAWYRGAGMLNLHPNHYGFYLRTGIVWQLER